MLYTGNIGEKVVDDMAANGGIITSDDLRDYQIQLREACKGHVSRIRDSLDGADQLGRGRQS